MFMIRSGNLRPLPQGLSRFFSFSLHLSFLLAVVIAFGLNARAQVDVDGDERMMLNLINEYRAQKGLRQLKISISLTRSAEWMSGDMAAKNYFSHTDSQGRDPFVRMSAFGYNYQTYKGENLAAGYSDPASTFNQWKNSAGHNAAMLNGNYSVIGIARVYGGSSTYKWYWTTDFGGYVDATLDGGGPATQPVKTVNAANFVERISPDCIVATFGNQLTPATASAPSIPLPDTLAGVTIRVNGIPAQLLYASPQQVNYIVPSNVAPGTAMVELSYNGALIGSGSVTVEQVSPSAFTLSASGQGTAAALTTFDAVSYQPVFNTDGTARPVSVGTATRPNYLVLFGTGMRRRSSLSAVSVTIGGVAVGADYVGAHSIYLGMDQVNVKLPQTLRGRGPVDVIITVDGRPSNIARINIGN
jgi:uncharacterized protein (TIGR03437 family)